MFGEVCSIFIFTTNNLSEWRDNLLRDDSVCVSHKGSISKIEDMSKNRPPEGGLLVGGIGIRLLNARSLPTYCDSRQSWDFFDAELAKKFFEIRKNSYCRFWLRRQVSSTIHRILLGYYPVRDAVCYQYVSHWTYCDPKW